MQVEATKEELIKKVLSGMAIVAALRLAGSVALAQDLANGEKTLKATCAGHGASAEGKPAMKASAIRGKSADDI